jgi:hypothetical protein
MHTCTYVREASLFALKHATTNSKIYADEDLCVTSEDVKRALGAVKPSAMRLLLRN